MGKAEATFERVVSEAMRQGSIKGFGSLSLSDVAMEAGLSKSAVFSHLGQREELQLTVITRLCERFTAEVWTAAMDIPQGKPRLKEVFERWLNWIDGDTRGGGCGVIQAQIEFDDQPGPTRDYLRMQQRRWNRVLESELRHVASTADPEAARQLAFELRGIVMAYNQSRRLMDDRSARTRANRAYARLMGAAAPGPEETHLCRPADVGRY